MTRSLDLVFVLMMPLLCGAQNTAAPTMPPTTTMAPNSTGGTNSTPAPAGPVCEAGVCTKGKWQFYLSSKSEAECKKMCEDGRRMVPVPEGVHEDVYNFRQNGQFHNVAGGKRKVDFERTVTQINYPGTGRNWPGWNQRDQFYAHWEGEIDIKKEGSYTFWTKSDDGSRLSIDSEDVVNNPGWHGMREREGKVADGVLKVGKHPFWAEMFEGGGGAGMQVYYRGPDTDDKKILMPASAFPAGIKEQAYYFRQNGQFQDISKEVAPKTITKSRKVENINYPSTGGFFDGWKDWVGIKDHFYVRWHGYINIKAAGKYTFYITSDDGSHLFIDDSQVVANPGWHGMREKSSSVDNMAAGKHKFALEMFEGGGGAGMVFYYSGPDTGANQPKIVVPKSALSATLEGSAEKELHADWKDTGKCVAYSHKDTECIIYSSCTELGSDSSSVVCEDTSFDWVEPSTFTTCKWPEEVLEGPTTNGITI